MANKEATRVSAHVDRVLEASTSFSGAGALGSAVVVVAGAGAGVDGFSVVVVVAGLGVAAGASQQVAASVPVTEAPLLTVSVDSPEQSTLVAASVFPVHLPVIGASQQVAASVPMTNAPLFTVFVGSPEQSTSPVPPVLPVHLPYTILEAVGQVTAGESSVKAPKLPHVNWVTNGAAPGTGL